MLIQLAQQIIEYIRYLHQVITFHLILIIIRILIPTGI